MKILLALPLILSLNCSHSVSQTSQPAEDPAHVRSRVMAVVETQRQNREWMKIASCPADAIPDDGRRPKIAAADCSRDPAKCMEHCEANDGDSCYALAQLIQIHDVIENEVADVLYRHACRLGVVSGCTNSASKLFETEDEESVSCAVRTFEIACAKDDPWACTMNGLALGGGIGRTKNIAKANRALDKACEVSLDKNHEACVKAKELKLAFARTQN